MFEKLGMICDNYLKYLSNHPVTLWWASLLGNSIGNAWGTLGNTWGEDTKMSFFFFFFRESKTRKHGNYIGDALKQDFFFLRKTCNNKRITCYRLHLPKTKGSI